MGYENTITKAINTQLKNPLVSVLKEIRIETLLRQSNFIKKEGTPPSTILLHFISMLLMNKNIASFIKYSKESLSKRCLLSDIGLTGQVITNYQAISCYNITLSNLKVKLWARRPRIDLAGYHHIINRGINRTDVFKVVKTRRYF